MDDSYLVAVTTTTDDRTHTGYVGGLSLTDIEALTQSTLADSVTPVTAVPYHLLRTPDCMRLVGEAERAGLLWHLSSVVAESEDGPVSLPHLRVYGPEMRALIEGLWHEGEWVAGSHSGADDAVHYLRWYTDYTDHEGADTDA